MLDACKFKTDQHTLTEKIVCNRQSRECMILRCENCPGTEPLRKHLLNEFAKLRPILDEADIGSSSSEDDEEEEEEQQVKFSQWVSTDRADIVKQRLPVSEFVDKLVDKLDALITHSFIASTQRAYIKKMRTELGVSCFRSFCHESWLCCARCSTELSLELEKLHFTSSHDLL